MGLLMLCEGSHGCTPMVPQAGMTLLTLLMLLPLGVLLQTAEPEAQKVEFVVLSTSVPREQKKPRPGDRNAYAFVGTTLRMVCRYRVSSDSTDYCAEAKATKLVVRPVLSLSETQGEPVEIDRTNCSVMVEFRNMSTAMEGWYACQGENGRHPGYRQRNIEVGEPPVEPQNVSLVYLPRSKIILSLDPVKTGHDLSEPGTEWSVEYKWKINEKYKSCRKSTTCKKLKQGMCQACVIKLSDYNRCGQYTGFGIITDKISFRINVSNIFGRVTINQTFDVTDWVKPTAIESLSLLSKSQRGLTVEVKPSNRIDMAHVRWMKESSPHPMKLRWSVDLVSARDQNLLGKEGQEFFDKYDIVRNLEDDQEALNQTLLATFPNSSRYLDWNVGDSEDYCSKLPNQILNITDLPFPGCYYNVSVESSARYQGDTATLNVTLAYTAEAAPVKGPELHNSFAYCDNSMISARSCVTCIIYFKEIPRSQRGSAVVNYTLTLELLNGRSLPHVDRCTGSASRLEVPVGSQDNSALIHSLEAGGEYNLTLLAYNSAGASPATSKILHVHSAPLPGTPRGIVLEKQYADPVWMYDLSWDTPNSGHRGQSDYFVHYCTADFIQLQERTADSSNQSSEALEKRLNCVTNMVTVPVNGENTFSFYQPVRKKDPTLAFFVSMVTPDGVSSGLQKVDCFYTKRRPPENKVWIQTVESSSHSVQVKFSVPCGSDLNYAYGRPKYYAIRKVKLEDSADACEQSCDRLMHQTDFVADEPLSQDNLQGSVSHELTNLDPETSYCVGVNEARGRWHCTVARTAKKSSFYYILEILLPILAVISFICLVFWLWRHVKKGRRKFGLTKSDLQVHVIAISSNQKYKLGGETMAEAESDILEACNPAHGLNRALMTQVSISNGSLAGSPVVSRNVDDRYPPTGISSGQGLAFLPVDPRMDDDNYSSQDSGEDGDEGDLDSEEHTEDIRDAAQQPLLSHSPTHLHEHQTRLPQQHNCPSAEKECRPLLLKNHADREKERKSLLADEEESDNTSGFCGSSGSDQSRNSDSTGLHHSGPEDHFPCQPGAPTLSQNHNGNFALQAAPSPACIPATQPSVTPSQTLGNGSSDTERACALAPQEENAVMQFSVDDILQSAEKSLNAQTVLFRGAEGSQRTRESAPLVVENILRAAERCPWKGQNSVTMPVRVQDHQELAARRDSACFDGSDSSLDTESAESESVSGNS